MSPASDERMRTGPLARALLVGFCAWLGLILLGAAFGGLLSFGTGATTELPKWNGWSYFAFSAREGASFAAIVTWPVGLIVVVVSLQWRRVARSTGPSSRA
jgi:hypothetical protein